MKGYFGNFGNTSSLTMPNFSSYYKISPELNSILSKSISTLTPLDLPPIISRINEIDGYINNNNLIIARELELNSLEAKRNDILNKLNSISKELNIVLTINQEKFKVFFSYLGPSDLENYYANIINSGKTLDVEPKITSISTPTTSEEIIQRKTELNVLNHILIKELNSIDTRLLSSLISEAKKSNLRLSQERENLVKLKNSIESQIKPEAPVIVQQPVETKVEIPVVTEVKNQIIETPQPKKKRNYWWLLVVAGVGTYLYTKE
jgi:hypothetical protein